VSETGQVYRDHRLRDFYSGATKLPGRVNDFCFFAYTGRSAACPARSSGSAASAASASWHRPINFGGIVSPGARIGSLLTLNAVTDSKKELCFFVKFASKC
jgi:hypothetical protein